MHIRRNFSHASVLKGQHCHRLGAHTKPRLGVVALTALGEFQQGTECSCESGLPLNLWPLWGEVEGTKTVGSWPTICPCARASKEIKAKQNMFLLLHHKQLGHEKKDEVQPELGNSEAITIAFCKGVIWPFCSA